MGVERPLRHRVAGDEHEVRPVLAQRPLPQRPLVRRRQVRLVRRRAGDLQRLGEVHGRDLRRHAGTASPAAARDRGHHAGQHRRVSTAITSRWSAMKPELGVERRVLRQVPGGVVRLGPEHRPDLVDPLEDPDHQLLVELRRLGQVRRAGRSSRARRRSRPLSVADADDLRRVDLDEAAARPVWPGTRRSPRPTIRSAAARRRVAQRQRRVVELGGQGRASAPAGTGRTAAVRRRAPSTRTAGSVSSTPAGAAAFAATVPVTSTTLSSVSASTSARGAGSVTTTWVSPAASRTIRKATDLSSRRRWTQPATVTVSPTWAGSSVERMRCIGGPPRRCATRPQGGVGERDPRGATTPSRPGSRGASCRTLARECLRAPAPGHLHSCRWLSRPAVGALLGSVVAVAGTLTAADRDGTGFTGRVRRVTPAVA